MLGHRGEGRLWGEVGCVDLCPSLDDRKNFGRCEVGECEIVIWGECYHIAFACHSICAEEKVRKI